MPKLKTLSILCAASALALTAGAATAAPLTVTGVTGSWISADPGNLTSLNGIGTNELRWGVPHSSQDWPGGQKSGYDFVGKAPPKFGAEPDKPFDLGTFTHHNYPINEGTSITGATLEVTFSFYLGNNEDDIITKTSQFRFDHWETPNGSQDWKGNWSDPTVCQNGVANGRGVNVNGCADQVTVSTLAGYTETFTMIENGVEHEYVFAVSGFDAGEEFWTVENQGNSTKLYASYTYAKNILPAPIPLPAAGWLLLGGIGALGVARRRRKAA